MASSKKSKKIYSLYHDPTARTWYFFDKKLIKETIENFKKCDGEDFRRDDFCIEKIRIEKKAIKS